jgi:hypothetical protein
MITPLQLLQEFCNRESANAKFDCRMVDPEDKNLKHFFEITAELKDKTGTYKAVAQARNKKQAKQAAVEKLWLAKHPELKTYKNISAHYERVKREQRHIPAEKKVNFTLIERLKDEMRRKWSTDVEVEPEAPAEADSALRVALFLDEKQEELKRKITQVKPVLGRNPTS